VDSSFSGDGSPIGWASVPEENARSAQSTSVRSVSLFPATKPAAAGAAAAAAGLAAVFLARVGVRLGALALVFTGAFAFAFAGAFAGALRAATLPTAFDFPFGAGPRVFFALARLLLVPCDPPFVRCVRDVLDCFRPPLDAFAMAGSVLQSVFATKRTVVCRFIFLQSLPSRPVVVKLRRFVVGAIIGERVDRARQMSRAHHGASRCQLLDARLAPFRGFPGRHVGC
jgi:hypothetical protein